MSYNRSAVYEYAKKWALGRNPRYYNYDNIGGDCTNFVSQCIYAGCKQMNYSKNNGWYYINANNKSPSWTGVQFLYNFLISNKGTGPCGIKANIEQLQIGDIIQLSFDGTTYSHSLVVVQNGNSTYNTFVAAHTFDVFHKRLYDYVFTDYRCIHIK